MITVWTWLLPSFTALMLIGKCVLLRLLAHMVRCLTLKAPPVWTMRLVARIRWTLQRWLASPLCVKGPLSPLPYPIKHHPLVATIYKQVATRYVSACKCGIG